MAEWATNEMIDTSSMSGEERTAAQANNWARENANITMGFNALEAEKNREFQESSARKAMNFEAEQAAINRDWQAEMSNTAYQRSMADMKKAGLNPILAYQQGGASTPSGATAAGKQAQGSQANAMSPETFKADTAAELQAKTEKNIAEIQARMSYMINKETIAAQKYMNAVTNETSRYNTAATNATTRWVQQQGLNQRTWEKIQDMGLAKWQASYARDTALQLKQKDIDITYMQCKNAAEIATSERELKRWLKKQDIYINNENLKFMYDKLQTYREYTDKTLQYQSLQNTENNLAAFMRTLVSGGMSVISGGLAGGTLGSTGGTTNPIGF